MLMKAGETSIRLGLDNHGDKIASNSWAELGAILEVLRQNETDDLEIESDSLTSLRAICILSPRYEDLNWSASGVQNADLIMGPSFRSLPFHYC